MHVNRWNIAYSRGHCIQVFLKYSHLSQTVCYSRRHHMLHGNERQVKINANHYIAFHMSVFCL
jgi:hypothetical protein